MNLDPLRKIAAAEIAFYVPIFCIAFFITLKHGFGCREGWVFLFTFSLIRIVGAAISIASRTESNPAIGLTIAEIVLRGIGLAPLLLATLGFITTVAKYGFPTSARPLRLVRVLLLVAVILASAGVSMTSPENQPSIVSTGRTLTRVGIVLFMAAYVFLLGLHVALWGRRQHIPTHNRTLLSGVSFALPPLFVRLLYALLGASASSTQSRWSPAFGDWKIYLVMGLVMEYLVVCVYVIAGAFTPLHKGEEAEDEERH